MSDDPYESPRGPAEPRTALAPQFPWLWPLLGIAIGLLSAPICWLILLVSMHEDHDPPLAHEISRAWLGLFPVAAFTAWVGFCFGLSGKLIAILLRRAGPSRLPLE